MVQLECTFAGQNVDGVWILSFSDGSGIEFSDEDSFLSFITSCGHQEHLRKNAKSGTEFFSKRRSQLAMTCLLGQR